MEPLVEPGAWVSGMEIYQAESAHQVCELTVMHTYSPLTPVQEWRTPAGATWAENTPIRIKYGWWQDDSAEFFGYVASSRILASESDKRYGHAVQVPVVYTLVGASMPLQTRRNRTWLSTTPSAIARQIAVEANLQPRIDVTDVLFEQRIQACSDWMFLVELADLIGYRVYCDGSVLWFVDRQTVLQASDGSVPQFWQSKTPGVVNSIRQFSSMVGDTDPAGGVRATYETVAFNTTSGILTPASYTQARTSVQGQQITPLLRRQYSDRPTRSWDTATRLLETGTDWMWVESRAVVNGDPRLRPGSVCDLQGTAIGDANTGLWMVRGSTHKIAINYVYPQKSEYTTTLVLGRNDARDLPLKHQDPTRVPAPTRLVSGRWRAQYTGDL